jgi:hypothetical protein
MIRPNKNALAPASLATDGEQGEGARAEGHCGAQHTPHESAPLFLARVAIDAARVQLNAYALATDDPLPGTVEAADLLDAARAALNGAS